MIPASGAMPLTARACCSATGASTAGGGTELPQPPGPRPPRWPRGENLGNSAPERRGKTPPPACPSEMVQNLSPGCQAVRTGCQAQSRTAPEHSDPPPPGTAAPSPSTPKGTGALRAAHRGTRIWANLELRGAVLKRGWRTQRGCTFTRLCFEDWGHGAFPHPTALFGARTLVFSEKG